MNRTAQAVIDISALQYNFNQVRKYAPQSQIMCAVKANAYGHGLLPVAQALGAADAFAVACVEEGVELRKAGIEKSICIFQGFQNTEELQACVAMRLSPVVHQHWQLDLLAQLPATDRLDIWLKINTGMNRLGFEMEEAQPAWQRIAQIAAICETGLMTHFAVADQRDHTSQAATEEQINQFRQLTASWLVTKSAANSAALLAYPEARMDWVRPGLMLYGVNPFTEPLADDYFLRPAMTLKTRLIAVYRRKRGAALGYGGEWRCPQDMSIGIAAIGYGDGYPRNVRNGTPVLVNGQAAAIAGRVSMDMISLDLSAVRNPQVGDEVILWGQQLPIEKIAESAGTIAYELLCNVYGRVQYSYLESNEEVL